jgi:hypothetical protein
VKAFYEALPHNKIEINWNKHPIKMAQFLSFLTVTVKRSEQHLGAYTGWTLLLGTEGLKIGGGKVRDVEYLNSLEYQKKLANPYNNYVNPFYLFDILNEEGKAFFLNYYADDINALLDKAKSDTALAQRKALAAAEKEAALIAFWRDKKLN